jgi:hypothetical protein
MKQAIAILTAALLVAGMTSANAEPLPAYTGNDLLPACAAADAALMGGPSNMSRDTNFKAGYCMGEMAAILFFSQVGAMASGRKPCLPEDTTVGQMVGVTVNYLQKHPEERDLDFTLLAIKATNRAWHCGEE